MRNRPVLSWDVALAAVGAAALITEGQLRSASALSPAAYVLAVAAAAPLVWRTRAPLAALVGVEAGAIVCAAVFPASWSASAPSHETTRRLRMRAKLLAWRHSVIGRANDALILPQE